MALSINTNVASLNVQRNLSKSQSTLETSLQRLSTGLRINTAKDDAAGLAITERFTTQIRGLNQAVRNANDGISLSQTAESALGEVTNNLQRIRELAVQSANSTNSASDRAALQQEVTQRIAEIERISSQTAFNGLKVLDGTFGSSQFQVGANAGETININLAQGTKSTQIGQLATSTSVVEVTNAALTGSGTYKVGSDSAVTVSASTAGNQAGQTASSAYAKKQSIDAAGIAGLTVAATNTTQFSIVATTSTGTAGTAVGTATYSLAINDVDIFNAFDSTTGTVLTAQQITDAVNAQSSNTGVTAVLNGADLQLTAADGRDIAIGQTSGTGVGGGITAGGAITTVDGIVYQNGSIGTFANATTGGTDSATEINGGTISLTATENITVTGDGVILGFANAGFTIAKDTTTLDTVDISTVVGSNEAIQRVDAALTTISTLRSSLGAIQNRFESTVSNLQAVSENLSAARGRIQDADFASETANLTKAQILQQAGISILTQANTLPQAALSLLQ